MSNFQEGDVVILKSGGPQMTVSTVRSDGAIVVLWYDNASSTLKTEVLKSSVLRSS